MPYFEFLPEIIILAGIFLVLVLMNTTSGKSGFLTYLVAWISLACATIMAAILLASGDSQLWDKMLSADEYSWFFKVLIGGGTTIILLTSWPYIRDKIPGRQEFSLLILTSVFGLMLTVSSVNFIMLIVALETASLGMYVLAASMKQKKISVEAGIKFFLTGAFSTAIMLWGISILFGISGSLDFDTIRISLLDFANSEIKPFPLLAVLTIFVGLGFKITLFPFYLWAPDVYQGSPTPFSAFLASISKVAGIAVLIRVVIGPIHHINSEFAGLFAILAAFTMLAASATALWQVNAKRLLAFSGISQAGFMMIGLAAFQGPVQSEALASSLFYLPGFIIATAGAFIIVANLEQKKDSTGLAIFNGLSKTNPMMAFAMLIFLASLAGLPPTLGFMGKYLLFVEAYSAGLKLLLACGIVVTVVSIVFYFYIVKCMFINHPDDIEENTHEPRSIFAVPAQIFKQALSFKSIDPDSVDIADGNPENQTSISTYLTTIFVMLLSGILLIAMFFWQPIYDICLNAAQSL